MEPYTLPDIADSPDDEVAELAAKSGIPSDLIGVVVELIHRAGNAGLLERMGYGELSTRAAHELIRRVLGLLGDGQNVGMRVWALDFVAGTNVFGGLSETEIGQRWGFTRQNVSIVVRELKSKLGIAAVPGTKADHTRKGYAERCKASHAAGKIQRRKPWAWNGAQHFLNTTNPTHEHSTSGQYNQ